MNALNVRQFEQWSRDNAQLGHAVVMAQAFAQCQRERVNAYIKPVFERFDFYVAKRFVEAGRPDERITEPKNLYLADDEEQEKQFYEACDVAHREHGFKGQLGHCPALVAENLLMEAERYLLESASEVFGVDFTMVFGEKRKQALDLLLGATIKAWSESRKAA